jgi:hypothetical protein
LLACSSSLGRLAKRPLCPARGSVRGRTADDGFHFGGVVAEFHHKKLTADHKPAEYGFRGKSAYTYTPGQIER